MTDQSLTESACGNEPCNDPCVHADIEVVTESPNCQQQTSQHDQIHEDIFPTVPFSDRKASEGIHYCRRNQSRDDEWDFTPSVDGLITSSKMPSTLDLRVDKHDGRAAESSKASATATSAVTDTADKQPGRHEQDCGLPKPHPLQQMSFDWSTVSGSQRFLMLSKQFDAQQPFWPSQPNYSEPQRRRLTQLLSSCVRPLFGQTRRYGQQERQRLQANVHSTFWSGQLLNITVRSRHLLLNGNLTLMHYIHCQYGSHRWIVTRSHKEADHLFKSIRSHLLRHVVRVGATPDAIEWRKHFRTIDIFWRGRRQEFHKKSALSSRRQTDVIIECNDSMEEVTCKASESHVTALNDQDASLALSSNKSVKKGGSAPNASLSIGSQCSSTETENDRLQTMLLSFVNLRYHENLSRFQQFLGVGHLSFCQPFGPRLFEGFVRMRLLGATSRQRLECDEQSTCFALRPGCLLQLTRRWKWRWLILRDGFLAFQRTNHDKLSDIVLLNPQVCFSVVSIVKDSASLISCERVNNGSSALRPLISVSVSKNDTDVPKTIVQSRHCLLSLGDGRHIEMIIDDTEDTTENGYKGLFQLLTNCLLQQRQLFYLSKLDAEQRQHTNSSTRVDVCDVGSDRRQTLDDLKDAATYRFGATAPPRQNQKCCWFVDGNSYFTAVADAIEAAQEEIFIADWWLSPDAELKRPVCDDHRWRIDQLLLRRAQQGVFVYVLVYREVPPVLAIGSHYSKQRLTSLHPNIRVIRHPGRVNGGIFFWSHHEKLVVIDQQYAFVSGLDLTLGRWDTFHHMLTDIGGNDRNQLQSMVERDLHPHVKTVRTSEPDADNYQPDTVAWQSTTARFFQRRSQSKQSVKTDIERSLTKRGLNRLSSLNIRRQPDQMTTDKNRRTGAGGRLLQKSHSVALSHSLTPGRPIVGCNDEQSLTSTLGPLPTSTSIFRRFFSIPSTGVREGWAKNDQNGLKADVTDDSLIGQGAAHVQRQRKLMRRSSDGVELQQFHRTLSPSEHSRTSKVSKRTFSNRKFSDSVADILVQESELQLRREESCRDLDSNVASIFSKPSLSDTVADRPRFLESNLDRADRSANSAYHQSAINSDTSTFSPACSKPSAELSNSPNRIRFNEKVRIRKLIRSQSASEEPPPVVTIDAEDETDALGTPVLTSIYDESVHEAPLSNPNRRQRLLRFTRRLFSLPQASNASDHNDHQSILTDHSDNLAETVVSHSSIESDGFGKKRMKKTSKLIKFITPEQLKYDRSLLRHVPHSSIALRHNRDVIPWTDSDPWDITYGYKETNYEPSESCQLLENSQKTSKRRSRFDKNSQQVSKAAVDRFAVGGNGHNEASVWSRKKRRRAQQTAALFKPNRQQLVDQFAELDAQNVDLLDDEAEELAEDQAVEHERIQIMKDVKRHSAGSVLKSDAQNGEHSLNQKRFHSEQLDAGQVTVSRRGSEELSSPLSHIALPPLPSLPPLAPPLPPAPLPPTLLPSSGKGKSRKVIFADEPNDDKKEQCVDPTNLNRQNETDDLMHQLWLGKDYANFIISGEVNYKDPLEDCFDRRLTARTPWHDCGCFVRGEAALDVARHFIQRWNFAKRDLKLDSKKYNFLLPKSAEFVHWQQENDAKKLMHHIGINGTDDSNTLKKSLPLWDRFSVHHCDVQMLRSGSSWSVGLGDLDLTTATSVPETSIHNAYCHLISTAKHYVYIENQYFISSIGTEYGAKVWNTVMDSIVKRIALADARGEMFRVYLLLPLESIPRPVMVPMYRTLCRGLGSLMVRLKEALNRNHSQAESAQEQGTVTEPKPKRRVQDYLGIFSLRNWGRLESTFVSEMIYIHSKLMIVDDRAAIIGSANINDRSLRGNRDSEVALLFEDRQYVPSRMNSRPYEAGSFARSLRMRLMREHLGLGPPAGFVDAGVGAGADLSHHQAPASSHHADHLGQPGVAQNSDGCHGDAGTAQSPISDDIDLSDPVCDQFWYNVWLKTARRNSRWLWICFCKPPSDKCRTRLQLNQALASISAKYRSGTNDKAHFGNLTECSDNVELNNNQNNIKNEDEEDDGDEYDDNSQVQQTPLGLSDPEQCLRILQQKVRGHLVQFPTRFMEKEKLKGFYMLLHERYAPQSLFL